MSRSACTHAWALAVLLEKSPSPATLTLAPANNGPAAEVMAVKVNRRVSPGAISAMAQITENTLAVHTPPGMLAEVMAWLRLMDSTALRTGSARRLLTSA